MNVHDNIRRRARGAVRSRQTYMREHVIGVGHRRTRDEILGEWEESLRSSSSTVSTEQILADLDEDRDR